MTAKKERSDKWKSLPAIEKQSIRKLNRSAKREAKDAKKVNWKCSGKKRGHGMRSSVAKTWDPSKQTAYTGSNATAQPDMSLESLTAIASRLEPITQWPVEWILARGQRQILVWARKYL